MRLILTTLGAIGLATVFNGCAGQDEAVAAARAEGYLNPRVIDTFIFTSEFHCWDEDDRAYELEALDRSERLVKLIACCYVTCSIRKALF